MSRWRCMCVWLTLRFLGGVTLASWRVYMDIGQGQDTTFSSNEGLTPSQTIIFMIKLQNGRIVHVTNRAAVFPMI